MKSGSLHDPVIDDVRDFKVCDDAMTHLGMTEEERFSVYTVVASVLHLGNIGFEDNHEDTKGLSHCFMISTNFHCSHLNVHAVFRLIFYDTC